MQYNPKRAAVLYHTDYSYLTIDEFLDLFQDEFLPNFELDDDDINAITKRILSSAVVIES